MEFPTIDFDRPMPPLGSPDDEFAIGRSDLPRQFVVDVGSEFVVADAFKEGVPVARRKKTHPAKALAPHQHDGSR